MDDQIPMGDPAQQQPEGLPPQEVDLAPLNQFLLQSCSTLLDLNKDKFNTHLHTTFNQNTLMQFATDKNHRALLISKVDRREADESKKDEEDESLDKTERDLLEGDEIRFSLIVQYTGHVAHTVAFLKRDLYEQMDLKADDTLEQVGKQVQVINLGYIGEDFNVFELAANYVEYSLVPLFNSYKQTKSNQADKSGAAGFDNVQKNLAQLKVNLVQCQQNIIVPEIELIHDPDIKTKFDENNNVTLDDFEDRLKDPNFVKRLEKTVTQWIKDIQKITQLSHNPQQGSSLQEVNFWSSIERSLELISEQMRNKKVDLTLQLLKRAQKIQLVYSFQLDTELDQKLKTAKEYNKLLKDLPINQLLSANTLEEIRQALSRIFDQLKSLRSSGGEGYPPNRAVQLIDTIIRDLNEQLMKILASFAVMHLEYSEFEILKEDIKSVFTLLSKKIHELRSHLTQNRLRLDKPVTKILDNLEKNQLRERLERIFIFRKHHNEFKQIIRRTLSQEVSGDKNSLEEVALNQINEAYQFFHSINVLDISQEGFDHWDQTERTYNLKIDKVESQITSILKSKLSQAQNANEMFRVFQIFNALFTRPRIRGAIQEYQTQLLIQVEKDIQVLQDKLLRRQEVDSEQFGKVKSFPETSNNIIWMHQIERRLEVYMKRVENVLGSNWKDLHQGKKLKSIGDSFQQVLRTKQERYLLDWVAQTKDIDASAEKHKNVFNIEQRIDRFHFFLDIKTEFLNLPNELNQLLILGFKKNIPLSVVLRAQDVQNLYPIVSSLQESLRTFEYNERRVDKKFAKLVAESRLHAQQHMTKGLAIQWKNDSTVEKYSRELKKFVTEFEDAVNDVTEKIALIDQHLEELSTSELDQDILAEKIEKIQKIIDVFEMEGYSNLQIWVDELDVRISGILTERLEKRIKDWVEAFSLEQGDAAAMIDTLTMKIKMQNRTFILDPPLAEGRAVLYTQLHQQIEIICGLKRFEAQRYARFRGQEKQKDKTYSKLVKQMKNYNITDAYEAIEGVCKQADGYFQVWKQYQALWDLQSMMIYDTLGDDVERWTQLLNEIRHGRKTFDTSDDKKVFGPLNVHFGGVKTDVSNKYDLWHKEILNKFGSQLKQSMTSFYQEIQTARRKLEGLSIDASEDVTTFVTEIQEIKRKVKGWEQTLERQKKGQKLLNSQRYQFPNDWIWIDIIEFEWNQSFKQIMQKKVSQMEDQIPVLQAKILDEEKVCNGKIKEIEDEWDKNRPRDASFQPREALDQLNILGKRIQTANNEWIRICKAKELLDMELGEPERLQSLVEDLELLRGVWTEIHKLWQTIDSINETPLSGYVHKKVKEALDQLLEQMNGFPNRLRSLDVYDEFKAQLMNYRKVNAIYLELKSEAMKPRHWKQLLQKLKVKVPFNDLLLVHLWQADLLRNQKTVNEILAEARGELILEEFIRNIKDCWAKYELELTRYKSKCKLIKGWDDLFAQIDEHINNISSMKMSPYYKVFEEEIVPWDEKLQKIRIIFDNWIDVQRRYVYLEGIFFGSADIKSMLSTEFNKFRGIDNEFTSLMKKVNQKPIVLDVMAIQGLSQNLERFSDMLSKIQKALGDYLERQRQSFARFYFVGDEDLLEIIGNSKEIKMVQRHFPKMFAGITSTNFDNDGDRLNGMFSREGEYVDFSKPVVISEDPTIYVWLTKIESEMQMCLALKLQTSIDELETIDLQETPEDFTKWIEKFPAQIDILSMQVSWSNKVEDCLKKSGSKSLVHVEKRTMNILELLADRVLMDLSKDIRQKYEQLITDLVHQREVTRQLITDDVQSINEFPWLYHMRFYFNPKQKNALEQLQIMVANGQFYYGFEYLGVGEKLVQTPLTDRCYLTLTQALHWRLGGSPFGPAGTGKTESVKALGSQLGRYVLVFNCDETFDGNAMGRIFVGLCQVGAWGCFDEFNRLEERMLSAVSQQILIIQTGLKEMINRIDLMGRDVKLNDAMGIFITMNPGYAGRSNLPDNLKQLFRQIAMVKPNKEMIARVKLYSQGFKTAEKLSGKIVSLFDLCLNQLSSQSHYDFGLRALKSVLVSAGNLKRAEKLKLENPNEEIDDEWEQNILLQSVCHTLVPKLIAQDIPLLESLLTGVFPGSTLINVREENIRNKVIELQTKFNIQAKSQFIEKVLQLYQIQYLHHGVMMVGPTGCGKSQAWRILLCAMEKIDGIKGESYIIDPKAINKEELYGKLDSTTAEWTDGVFTQILRKVIDNHRGESSRRHWILFDGDVDPEWAENLNSVLDDNKLLTLPSGERLQIPDNVRIMFEVETLKYATLATVSRCGMVWFSDDTVSVDMVYNHYLLRLKQDDYDSMGEDPDEKKKQEESGTDQPQMMANVNYEERRIRKQCVDAIMTMFDDSEGPSFMTKTIEYAETLTHVMEFTKIRCLESFFALVRRGISNVIEYNENHSDFPLSDGQVASYMTKWVVFASLWGIGGSLNLQTRTDFGEELKTWCSVDLPTSAGNESLLDFEVRIDDQQWHLWKARVPKVAIDPSKVTDASTVINTVDTCRHQEVLCSWLSEHRPFLLCGPPGSGKTMTLMATLKMLTDMEMIFINFSSSTQPELILKTFDHYCEYKKTTSGIILRPRQLDKWLVVFCDEINLPEPDKYSTQVVIAFLRQITEHRGFWRSSDKQFVKLERIQFVGACNPPTDAGRTPMSDRFLRHAPLIFVDFPGPESLKQIYGTFNQAMLSRTPALRSFADPLTESMVEFYTLSQQHFTADQQPHYIYSPRELTRWKYAIFEALSAVEDVEDLVRLFVHEGLRLFEDRLVYPEEKEWCNQTIDDVAKKWFPSMDTMKALKRPIYFTNFIKKDYVSVSQEELKAYIEGRLRTFNEEELNVQLVVFDTVIDHILRIDRVLRQPLGHLLLVGASGVGKTTLTRFVAWLNNLQVFQIKAGRNYSVYDFDEDLRTVMKRAGTKHEKICFIFDESNVLSAAFLERMNALLASGEVPGLFDGEDYMALINACKEAALREGKIIDTEDELYKHFIYNVQRNLHVVFTMNPANPDFSNRTASSPALFNRCVIDWFGDWSDDGLLQVTKSFTENIDVAKESFTKDVGSSEDVYDENQKGFKVVDPRNQLLSECIVQMHIAVRDINKKLMKSAKKFNYITPRDFLDFIKHFIEIKDTKKEELVELQGHLNRGLDKLKESEDEVVQLQATLKVYKEDLQVQEKAAEEKMATMLNEQRESLTQKDMSEKAAVKLAQKQKEIAERKIKVDEDLGKAEPALIAAQESVSGINRNDLNELRAYAKPPPKVQLALEPVVALINKATTKPDWKEIKVQVKRDDFIKSIMNFDKNDIPTNVKVFINENYLKDEKSFDPANIMKASKAAGPLALWVKSIVEYSTIFHSITPLRNELRQLEEEESKMTSEKAALDSKIIELEENINSLKKEYAMLIAKVESIKNDMKNVQIKVDRSVQLIQNLSSERNRWEETSRNFENQMACLVGDCLFAGGFLTYIGFFDHFYRRFLQNEWRDCIDQVDLKMRQDMKLTEFLSRASDKLLWENQGLPNDELCIENAIIMKSYNRYPLVIDPSDQAIKFLMNHFAKDKIQKTSFADDSFMKHLETAIRFGLPLLVQDVEKIDPILNSVLNKEVQKAGGRILIRVGDQEIDYSDKFTLYMITRDPNAVFTPDLCSRVTFVNFTVTPSSLQNQCLNIFLKEERPEIDKKRNDIIKLQSEFRVKLRELEDQLLNELTESEGNILQNDKLIQTLETLQKEAKEIAKEVEQADETMHEVEKVTEEYEPLANMSSRIFFSLDSLSSVHFLYQFSLQYFMEILFNVIQKSEKLKQVPKSNHEMRREVLTQEFFNTTFDNVSRGLFQEHQTLFALRLVQIRKQENEKFNQMFSMFLRANTIIDTQLPTSIAGGKLSSSQLASLEELDKAFEFQGIVRSLETEEQRWINYLDDPTAEGTVPEIWRANIQNLDKPTEQVLRMILLKSTRSDRLVEATKQLFRMSINEDTVTSGQINLGHIVESESNAKSPLLLVSAPGYDASFMVDHLAKTKRMKYTSVAIGSPEAFEEAETAIKLAARSGSWVLLKNVHLAPQWLVELEKTIYKLDLKSQSTFRLFLTMEVNPKVPTTLLRASYVLMFEPPQGIKAALTRSYTQAITQDRSDQKPVQRAKLHFIVAWFNAVVQERLRYIPIGWSKVYEFNQSDQRCVLDCIDEWIDSMGKGREAVDPDKIPWDALKTLISQSIFGGKIDNEFDQKILQSLVDYFFRKETFNMNYPLFDSLEDKNQLTIPDYKKYEEFFNWTKQLPNVESPAWSGLPLNVEKLNRMKESDRLMTNIKLLQGTDDDEIQAGGASESTGGQAQWLVNLKEKVNTYFNLLPSELKKMKRGEKSVKNPLFRFLDRECSVLSNLLQTVHSDFKLVLEVCEGERKSTNYIKTIAQDLHSDVIPKHWKKYVVPETMTASEWLNDFKKRVDQMDIVSTSVLFGRDGIWFGGLLSPEAYLIATQQATAQLNEWSLEELDLRFVYNPTEEETQAAINDQTGFIIKGLSIESAEYEAEDKRIKLSSKLQSNLPTIILQWVHKSATKTSGEDGSAQQFVELPVYLNKSRKNLLCSVKMETFGVPAHVWYQRGVALFAF